MELSFHDLRLLEEGLVFSGEWHREHIEALTEMADRNLESDNVRDKLLESHETRLAEIDALLERMNQTARR